MSFSFDLPENPSTSAEFLTASESAINFTEDAKLKTDHIRNSNVLSNDASLTETTHSNHAPSSDKSACVSPSVYENSNESRRTSEVESNQDVTSPGYSEVGSVASPRFDFDQPLKNDYYDYLAPSANRANEVYGGYRLNLSSSPIGHNESSPMGNVPSDTEAGFIDEDSVLEYYPHAYRDRDDGPYYDLRTVLDNNSYDYLSDFTHYEDNYRAQQEFYDERATDSDNTLSTDESSFSSRQRFMLPLDTIEEIEESPRATEEFGHDNQSLDDYLTPGERDTGEYGEPREEETHESVTSSSRTSSSSVESSRTSCEDEFQPALHSPSYNAQQELLAVNTTSAHNLSANLCDTEDSSVTRFHSCVSRELDDLENTENVVSSENRNTLDNAKPMPVNSTSENVKKINGIVNNSDYRLSQELSLTLSDDEEEEGTALRIPDSVMNSKLARFGGSLSDISSSGFPFGVGRGGGAGAAGGGGGSGGGSRRPSASNPNAAAATESLIQNLTLDDRMIELTKQKLYYHFQNPCWKFRVKGTKPIKMMVQVIKIIFVTLQLSLFSKYQFDFRLFIDGNFQTFDHLFLLNWEADYGDPVQRVPDPYAVYHIDDFYASVNFTVTSYFTLTYKALGNFSYPVNYNGESHNGKKKHRGGSALGPAANLPNDEIPPIIFKLTFYEVEADPDQPYHMKLEGDPVSKYYYVYYGDTDNGEFDMVTWEGQKDNDFSLNWSSLLSFEIKFSLINQHIGSSRTYFKPVCYLFNISITYDNSRHTGKLPINSKYTDSTTDCVSITYESSDDGVTYMVLMTIMDCCITALAVFSLVLCVRSVQHNWYLRRVTKAIWLKKFNKPLGKKDEAKFVQFWYFIIIVGDCCLIAGSLLKIFVTFRVTQVYTVCAVLLGCATMIVWIGVLKYLNYFHTYNALLLTLKYSMPNVLRFLFCCLFIYFGFALAGWAVFGPFHYKFRTFVATMETMYSLINGDDMFETFAQMRRVSTLVYVFNQIWLYVFIGLFIYCVLSLFIGIITETYEQIRNAREKGGHPELTEMEQFFLEAVRDKDLIDSIKKMKHSRAFICICCMPDGFDDLAAVHVASNTNNDNNNNTTA